MKRSWIFIFITLLLFTSCVRNRENLSDENMINNSNIIYEDVIFESNALYQPLDTPMNVIKNYIINNLNLTINYKSMEELFSVINIDEINRLLRINENKKNRQYNTPVRNIQDYIFNNLNLRRRFNTIEEILFGLNLPENYIITESEREIDFHGGGIFDVSLIEWDLYKLTINKVRGQDRYWFDSLIIEINDNNYKYLFPYETMKEYLSSNDFGELYWLSKNMIMYAIIGEENQGWLWFLTLFFENDILGSISIIPFIP